MLNIEESLRLRPDFIDHTAIITGLFFLILAIGVSFSCSILELRSKKYSFIQILVFFYLRILLSAFTLISNLNLFFILVPAILSPIIWFELVERFVNSKVNKLSRNSETDQSKINRESVGVTKLEEKNSVRAEINDVIKDKMHE